MNKKLLTSLLLVFAFSIKAQTISSIVLTPSSPDANDTLTFYIYCEFPYGSCDGMAFGSVAGTDIYAYGHHCMGALAFICNDIDTVVIPPQPAGNYNFYFTLDAGFGGPPCSPPFTPNDYDTLTFTISPATAVSDLSNIFEFSVFPNPSNGEITIDLGAENTVSRQYVIQNEIGSVISTGEIQNKATIVLPNGIYFISIPSLGMQQRVVVVK